MTHGGNLEAFSRHYHLREDEIIDFSSNVNPLGIPELLQLVYQASIDDLSLYPDPYAKFFREKIAQLFHLSLDHIIAGNGSIALLDIAMRALSPKRALLIEPSFTEYRRILKLTGAKMDHVLLSSDDHFRFPLETILDFLSHTDLIVFANPNNPTGSTLDSDSIQMLLKEAEKKGVFVIIDESFVDWVPELSVARQAGRSDYLLVIRSMTKFFALAGIRSGFALGPRKLIQLMNIQQGPWTCNRLAQKLSVAALNDISFQEKSRQWFQAESTWLFEALQNFRIFKVFPTYANFFLIKSELPLSNFFDFLGARGIYVRAANDFIGLDNSYFRIAVRTRQENELLIEAFNTWLKSDAPKEKLVHQ